MVKEIKTKKYLSTNLDSVGSEIKEKEIKSLSEKIKNYRYFYKEGCIACTSHSETLDEVEKDMKEFIRELKEDDYIELARFMHNTYEIIAKVAGWKTQKICKVKFNDLPEANKKTMYNLAIAIIQRNKEKADKLAGPDLI